MQVTTAGREVGVLRFSRTYVCSLLFVFLLFAGCALPRIIVLEDPLSPEEHINLGLAYEQKGEIDLAVREYEAAAEKIPAAYLYLGNVHFRNNDLEKAESWYRRAIEGDLGNAPALNNLAWLLYLKGQHLDEAESLAIRALSLNPPDPAAYQDTLVKIRELRAAQGRKP